MFSFTVRQWYVNNLRNYI
ncbi:unnamed protein product [Spodoptera littoralis]|uniref:Uncharacterized protein n=1 Tax=Spodoptera littoralis TaxID=7109 RepID=A0A9P0MZF5_SPOLI|nr:unnamed protein product [Spodoptera littoralis]CAH1636005.1 unnamed protein product [Spodoptera littoralis]